MSWRHKSRRYWREAEKSQAIEAPVIIGQEKSNPGTLGSHALGENSPTEPPLNLGQFAPPAYISAPSNTASLAFNGSTYGITDSKIEEVMPGQKMLARAESTHLLSCMVAEKDPYEHIELLGTGAYGYVDRVKRRDDPSTVFARKTICITSGRNRETQLKSVEREYEMLKRLKHFHVMRVVNIYSFRDKLSIIMLDVADTDMEKYLDKLDNLDEGPERREMLKPIFMWQGCLIQAIDYLHEMKIKHRDLKPANILVKDGKVIITDFGIAKDVIDEETTQSLISGGTAGTPMYMPPEVRLGGRRGRAVDIFSLGCIFLEIATCLIAGPGSRERFAEHREVKGSRAFSRCPTQILQWLWYLWGLYAECYVFCIRIRVPEYTPQKIFFDSDMLPGELAFLMLDPNSKTRITSRQLVQIMHYEPNPRTTVKRESCVNCGAGASGWNSENIPLHSSFKLDREINFPYPAESALRSLLDLDWEGAKKLWLNTHMWW